MMRQKQIRTRHRPARATGGATILVAVASTMLLAPPAAQATEPSAVAAPSSLPVVVEEHFDTPGDTVAGWTQNYGRWRADSGALSAIGGSTGTVNQVITHSGTVLADTFSISADVTVDPVLRYWSGLAAHVSKDGRDMLAFRIAFTGSAAEWQLLSIRSSTVYAKGALAPSFRADVAYRMSMTSSGYGEYTVDLRDGSGSLLRPTGSNTTGRQSVSLPSDTALAGGGAGMYSNVGGMRFDDVTLSTSVFGTVTVGDALSSADSFASAWTRKQRSWKIEDGAATGAGENAMAVNTEVTLGSAFRASVEITLHDSANATYSGLALNVPSSSFSDQYVFRVRSSGGSASDWQFIRQRPSGSTLKEELIAKGALSRAIPDGEPHVVGIRTVDLERVALFVRPVSEPAESNLVKSAERIVALPAADRLVGGQLALYSHYSSATFSNARIATTTDKPGAIADGFDRPDSTDMRSSWSEGNKGDWAVRGGALQVVSPIRDWTGDAYVAIQQSVDLSGGAFAARVGLVVDGVPALPSGVVASKVWNGVLVNLRNYATEPDKGEPQQDYQFRMNDTHTQWQFLREEAGRDPVVLGSGALPSAESGTYGFEIVSPAPGTFRVSISLNGRYVLVPTSIVDPSPAPIAGGAVALLTREDQQRFDDVTVVSSHSDGAPQVVATSCVGMTLGHNPVGQSVLTAGDKQYVAYYGTDRYLRVASRSLSSSSSSADCADGAPAAEWTTRTIDSRVPDDAHNSITMAVDSTGQLHVIGNLHAGSLAADPAAGDYATWRKGGAYYRTTVAGDVTSLTRVTELAPRAQNTHITYPTFITLPGSGRTPPKLLISYRIGWSGGGTLAFDGYDPATKTWSAYSTFTAYGDSPVETGPHTGDIDDVYNAYPSTIARGSDGVYRMAWVWRNNADVRTTSRVSFAQSTDLVNWTTVTGASVSTPLRYDDTASGLIVDDVKEGIAGTPGVDNGLVQVTLQLDSADDPVLLYTTLDAQSRLQIFAAHFDTGAKAWRTAPVTNGAGGAAASGTGTVVQTVQVGTTSAYGLSQPNWISFDYSYGALKNHVIVDAQSGAVVADSLGAPRLQPLDVAAPTNQQWFVGSADLNGTTTDGRSWYLRWYALPSNGDEIVTPSGAAAPDSAQPSSVSLNPQPLWVYSTR